MARSDKLYDKSPKLARGEDDKVTVKKGGDKKPEKKERDDSGEPDGSPLPSDTKEMHERHLEEMKDMHKRHQKEVESKSSASAGEGEKKTEKDKKE